MSAPVPKKLFDDPIAAAARKALDSTDEDEPDEAADPLPWDTMSREAITAAIKEALESSDEDEPVTTQNGVRTAVSRSRDATSRAVDQPREDRRGEREDDPTADLGACR